MKKNIEQELADSDLAFNHANEIVGKLEAENGRLREALSEITAAYRACYPEDTEGLFKLPDSIVKAKAALEKK